MSLVLMYHLDHWRKTRLIASRKVNCFARNGLSARMHGNSIGATESATLNGTQDCAIIRLPTAGSSATHDD